jgi:hypothetical protein
MGSSPNPDRPADRDLPPTVVAARAIAEILWPNQTLLGGRPRVEHEHLFLVKELLRSNIDPEIFDSLVSREMDRRLKLRFGYCFLALTFVITAAAYAVVVLHGACGWRLPEMAITALVIEAPIQFVGLLYIIARNLFPDGPAHRHSASRAEAVSSGTHRGTAPADPPPAPRTRQ